MKKNLILVLLLMAVFQLTVAQEQTLDMGVESGIFHQDELTLLEVEDGVLSIPVAAEYQYTTECLIVIFTNTSLNSINQLWTFGDGDSSNIENPIHYYDEAGTYEVNLYAFSATGELDTASQEITIDMCTNIEDVSSIDKQAIKHNIYPNPSNDESILTIAFEGLSVENKGDFGLQVFDIVGRKMLDLSKVTATNQISIDGWPKGIYYYTLFDKKSNKFILGDKFFVTSTSN